MSGLNKLLKLIEPMPAFHRLLEELKTMKANTSVVLNAARPYLIAGLFENIRAPVLVITGQPENARKLHEQFLSWSSTKRVYLFPEPDALPYERMASDIGTEVERIKALAYLAGCNEGEKQAEPPLVVVSAAALMSRTTDSSDFVESCKTISLGMSIEPFHLLAEMAATDYRPENTVEIPGTMSHRGGIIDIYPSISENPFRIEFFGDTIDSIRTFDPATQRSMEKVSAFTVFPATELLAPRRMSKQSLEDILNGIDLSGCTGETKQQLQQDRELFLTGQTPSEAQFYAPVFNHGRLLDYVPPDTLIVLDEPASIIQAAAALEEEFVQIRMEKMERGELPRNFPTPYFSWDELDAVIKDKWNLSLEAWGIEGGLDFISAPGYAGKLPAFIDKTIELLGQQKRIVIVSHQANRLSELFAEKDVIAAPVEKVTQAPGPGNMVLAQDSLPEGWVMGSDTYLFTDAEIFGFVKQRRLVRKRPAASHRMTLDFVPDDYVVHVEHGIGKFTGVTMLNTAGSDKEYLVLKYARNDILYVPTDQIDRVSRYIGAGDRVPVLSRLGTQEWVRTRQRAKEAVEVLARDLLNLYASREVVPGFAFSRDTVWQQELEAAFPYVETPDQLEAQQEVKRDMEKPRPMDRLVCGDVGYGKTEVAIRAAFKAVLDGKQVTVLVPTTVLAQQHFSTFSERLEAFPVKVEVLSRFRSDREQSNIVAGLADGKVDICIGTHRLIQKDVVFKDLGLLIIDEEQRFGVNHKEYLKKMRQEVDVLTLSATPIPRTLHMSLVGVRDMSTMETPPEARLPVKTYVAEYNEHLIREAILRELERNGQVFFVHNRVQSIAMITADLRELVPEAEIAVGHGQMPEDELEKVMTKFAQGKIDILVCTTIIESGLDMPNANTIIINKADKFGLTQLYQLRGRVGRGANLAYAYFLYDGGKRLSPIAHKRLRTIYEATELGAGFGIAMKDLEIRGAGTLLGPRQSGHITAVGFSLYTRLLADAVEEQKAIMAGKEKPAPRLPPPAIDLPLDAFIPESYVYDVDTRLELYRTLSNVGSAEKLDDILKEYTDRFGKPPAEMDNLFYALRIKALGAKAHIESISTEEGQIVLRRFQGMPFNAERFMQSLTDGVIAGRTQIRIDYKKLRGGWRGALERVVRGLI
ncbi:MAG: transcription-repair coupling factor [Dehalococcoidales bacterium]|nr:transcription-repair coupling factor [Dehalococcoidales bacterium]